MQFIRILKALLVEQVLGRGAGGDRQGLELRPKLSKANDIVEADTDLIKDNLLIVNDNTRRPALAESCSSSSSTSSSQTEVETGAETPSTADGPGLTAAAEEVTTAVASVGADEQQQVQHQHNSTSMFMRAAKAASHVGAAVAIGGAVLGLGMPLVLLSVVSGHDIRRDEETQRLVQEALSADDSPDSRATLRSLAQTRGLGRDDNMRKEACGRLLGLSVEETSSTWQSEAKQQEYEALSATEHSDTRQVAADVPRSRWPNQVVCELELGERQQQLQRICNAVAVGSGGRVCYNQGLDNIASMLLITMGERAAFHILSRLSTVHLRDVSRSTLLPVHQLLEHALPHILAATDPQLAAHLLKVYGMPLLCTSKWVIAWFGHTLARFEDYIRFCDLFVASHPLMVLYVAAVMMQRERRVLLRCSEMEKLHELLSDKVGTGALNVEAIIHKALDLFARCPPTQLLPPAIMNTLTGCVGQDASLSSSGQWEVPELPKSHPISFEGLLEECEDELQGQQEQQGQNERQEGQVPEPEFPKAHPIQVDEEDEREQQDMEELQAQQGQNEQQGQNKQQGRMNRAE